MSGEAVGVGGLGAVGYRWTGRCGWAVRAVVLKRLPVVNVKVGGCVSLVIIPNLCLMSGLFVDRVSVMVRSICVL